MPAYDNTERVGSWIADVIGNEAAPSEEVGYTVTCATWPAARGDVITWTFVLTMRSPFFGADALAASATVQAAIPSEEGVRHFAVSSLGKLRGQFEQAKRGGLAAGNGHAKRQS